MTRNQSKSSFIERIRSDLSNTIDAILNHPYVFALEKLPVNPQTGIVGGLIK
ncbi:MAG: hypothetical protein M3P08_05885 [Thermoproteota archaeon]|jgi:hypothetical protein|nr:hypothetical protein [Thermoproteota archaeon]